MQQSKKAAAKLSLAVVLAASAAVLLSGLALARSDATIEETQFRIRAGGFAQESARCPGNKRALGGGVVQSGSPSDLRLLASGPLNAAGGTANTRDGDKARRWYANVDSLSEQERVVKVFAICSAASKATIESTEFKVPARRSVAWAFAKCPGNRRALGGGVVPSDPPGGFHVLDAAPLEVGLYVRASGPLDASGVTENTRDGDKAKQWYAAVGNLSSKEQDAKVFAICSAASKATIEATEFKVPGHGTAEGFARCPGNKRALGGGVVHTTLLAEYVRASGPLDATGVTANTRDGDKAKQWYAAVSNLSNREMAAKAFAICE